MAKNRTRGGRDTVEEPTDDTVEEPSESPEDNSDPVLPEPAAKTPKPVDVQTSPDRTPQIIVQAFVRGSKDPILHAFAHREKLAPGMRKLTRAQWQEEFEAFRGAGR